MLDPLVPSSSIDVKVENGGVVLTGRADWQYQREAAMFAVANRVGELQIVDDTVVERGSSDPRSCLSVGSSCDRRSAGAKRRWSPPYARPSALDRAYR